MKASGGDFEKLAAIRGKGIALAEEGKSIITAARALLKAGASENKKKKSLAEMDKTIFIEDDSTPLLPQQGTE